MDSKNENKKITMDRKYTYRNGKSARVICVDAARPCTVISLEDNGKCRFHYEDGKGSLAGECVFDLIEVKEEKTLEFWVTIYPVGFEVALTKEQTEREDLKKSLIARKKVIIKYCEGDEE